MDGEWHTVDNKINGQSKEKSNPNMSTNDIGKIMSLCCTTIASYLRKGTSLSWCNYDVQEEITKTSIKNGKANGKKLKSLKIIKV